MFAMVDACQLHSPIIGSFLQQIVPVACLLLLCPELAREATDAGPNAVDSLKHGDLKLVERLI
jgi:hypothetical protein